jgi:hypothetical protein
VVEVFGVYIVFELWVPNLTFELWHCSKQSLHAECLRGIGELKDARV